MLRYAIQQRINALSNMTGKLLDAENDKLFAGHIKY